MCRPRELIIIMRMPRTLILSAAVCTGLALTISAHTQRPTTTTSTAPRKAFSVVEATIPEMRAAMEQGRVTARELVRQYLVRIATYEDLSLIHI